MYGVYEVCGRATHQNGKFPKLSRKAIKANEAKGPTP